MARPTRARGGFTLVELLVVMAITVILLGLLFAPMMSGFNFVRRGQLTVLAQESARSTMDQVSRELADALAVCVSAGDYAPVPYKDGSGATHQVRYDGYIDVVDDTGKTYPAYAAMVDFVPPDDTLGLHGGTLAQPLTPQVQFVGTEAHPVVVRYFIGLARPYKEGPGGAVSPATWVNPYERPLMLTSEPDNTYILFRCEFDPYDPAFGNWAIPDPNNRGEYMVNPGFFYDLRKSPNGLPYAVNWRKASVAMVPLEDIDLIRFVQQTPGDPSSITAVSTVTFAPLQMVNDTAAAADPVQGGAPAVYAADHGNWAGVQNDGTKVAAPVAAGNAVALSAVPHIVVYEQTTGGAGNESGLVPVFDNREPNPGAADYPGRQRVLTWDSRSGTVQFAQSAAPSVGPVPSAVSSNGWLFFPLRDPTSVPNPQVRAVARIVPGTETVRVDGILYRRAQPGELVDTADKPADWNEASRGPYPASLPPPLTYTLSADGRSIMIGYPFPGPQNPLQPMPVPDGKMVEITFQYQTNRPGDVVRVDYSTKSLLNVTIGVRAYDPSTSKAMLVQLTNKVRLRNVGR